MSRVDNIADLEIITKEAQGKDMRNWDYIERYYMWDLNQMKMAKEKLSVPTNGTDIYDENLVEEIGKKVLYNGIEFDVIGLHVYQNDDCYIIKRDKHIHYIPCDEAKFI